MEEIKIDLSKAQEGNKISRDIVDKYNKVMVKKDTILDKETIDFLVLSSVKEIWIYKDSYTNQNEIKNTVDKIFSRVQSDEFMQMIYKIVLDFRTKNNL